MREDPPDDGGIVQRGDQAQPAPNNGGRPGRETKILPGCDAEAFLVLSGCVSTNLGALRIRQGSDRDKLVQHVTEVLPGDKIVAPAISFLARHISVGPLRRRRHMNSFFVHSTVKVSLLA